MKCWVHVDVLRSRGRFGLGKSYLGRCGGWVFRAGALERRLGAVDGVLGARGPGVSRRHCFVATRRRFFGVGITRLLVVVAALPRWPVAVAGALLRRRDLALRWR
jgi:hypothetical protein